MSVDSYITGLQHIGVPTSCIEETINFYQSIGFRVVHQTQNGAQHVVFLQLQNIVMEIYDSAAAGGCNGALDHCALDVTDIEAVWKWAKKGDYHFLDDEIQQLAFWEHGIRFFTILGPNHEKIEFNQIL